MVPRALPTLGLALLVAQVLAAPVQAAADSAVAVMYHRFGESALPATNIRMDQFERHIEILTQENYTVMDLPDMVDALTEGRPLPDRAVVITIDDAFASVYENAWPLLREAGLPFTLFVATEPVTLERPGYMTWAQIRELHDAGVTIGHHSHTHGHMPQQSVEANRREITEADALFERHLGMTPRLFAYPFGEADAGVLEVLREHGITIAFGQHSGAVHRTTDRLYLPRFPMNEAFGGEERFRTAIDSLGLPVADLSPAEPTLRDNPPAFGFTVAGDVGDLGRLNCFASHEGALEVEVTGSRVEARIESPFPPGRGRINCTLPGPQGRFHWFGYQYYVPE